MSKFNFKAVGGAVAALAVVWLVWQWGFCRFYVAPGYMAIITAKSGEALPPGQILAQPGQKGIQEQPLGEGRHFRNPWLYEHQDHAADRHSAGSGGRSHRQGRCGIARPASFWRNRARKASGDKCWGPASIG
jgi:hypothetical protein